MNRRELVLGSIALAGPARAWTHGGSGGAPFDPTSLFPGTGGWWDPSDHSTTFQDTAGTTPATTAGQPVARINDKSGNGNNLLQSTAGSRPTLQISGGFSYLLFDGTDDYIFAAFTLNIPISRVNAARVVTNVLNERLWDGNPDAAAAVYTPSPAPTITMFAGGVGPTDSTNMTTGADHVATEVWNAASSSLQVDSNTVNTGNPGKIVGDPTGGVSIASANGANAGNIRWYGGVWIGRVLTAPEIANCKTFFGAKAGLVL